MKTKYVIIGLSVLLIGASLLTSVNAKIAPKEEIVAMTGIIWEDNFDSYTNGQFLDGTPDDGGWKGWDNDPTWGSYVTDAMSNSAPHSVAIEGDSDLIQEFSGLTQGQFTLTTQIYVPDDLSGMSYFVLLSSYEDNVGQDNKWALQIKFDADEGIVESEFDDESIWITTDEWVELRVEVDLDTDWMQFYYGDTLLIEKAWTAGPNNDGEGILAFDAIDLFANGASVVYYDDFVLEGEAVPIPDISCSGELNWDEIKPEETVTADIDVSNVGEAGSLLDWEVVEWPEWGTWTFTPSSGLDLPEGDSETIEVSVVAPADTGTEFTGTVKIVNSEDTGDFCELEVYLKTPRTRTIKYPFLQKILELHPNAFPILRQLISL